MMAFSPTTKIHAMAASGNQCAFPECDELIFDIKNKSLLGQVAHIKDNKKGKPRYDDNQSEEERQSFENAIVLCLKHHKIVDDHHDRYPSTLLKKWKLEHEEKIAFLQDRNWITHPNTILLMEKDGSQVSASFWLDRNGVAQLYTKEQLAICAELLKLYSLVSDVQSFLDTLDTVKDESSISWAKMQAKKLNPDEQNFINQFYDILSVAHDVRFGEYKLYGAKDREASKVTSRKYNEDRLAEKTGGRPANPSFRKPPDADS